MSNSTLIFAQTLQVSVSCPVPSSYMKENICGCYDLTPADLGKKFLTKEIAQPRYVNPKYGCTSLNPNCHSIFLPSILHLLFKCFPTFCKRTTKNKAMVLNSHPAEHGMNPTRGRSSLTSDQSSEFLFCVTSQPHLHHPLCPVHWPELLSRSIDEGQSWGVLFKESQSEDAQGYTILDQSAQLSPPSQLQWWWIIAEHLESHQVLTHWSMWGAQTPYFFIGLLTHFFLFWKL